MNDLAKYNWIDKGTRICREAEEVNEKGVKNDGKYGPFGIFWTWKIEKLNTTNWVNRLTGPVDSIILGRVFFFLVGVCLKVHFGRVIRFDALNCRDIQ